VNRQHVNRAIHWDGFGGQAWYDGVTHHLRMAPRINGHPVQRLSYYPLSIVWTILEAGATAERQMTTSEQVEIDARLEIMSKVGRAVWE